MAKSVHQLAIYLNAEHIVSQNFFQCQCGICRVVFSLSPAKKFDDFDEIDKIKAGKEVRSTTLTVCFSHRGTEDTEKRQQILREPSASVREKNSSRSITAGKEVRSTALTVCFSRRGTEDTEKREQILRERKKFQPFNRSRKGGAKHCIDGLFFAQRHGGHGEAGTNPP
ncbi:MAG: hypothetical protein ACRCUY_04310 [Thermoguttaceae bacterium]